MLVKRRIAVSLHGRLCAVLAQVKIGMIPALISCFIVPRAGAIAVQYMLSGQRWTAGDLARCSLATAVPDVSALRSTVDAFVRENLLSSSSRATAAIKRLAAHVSTHSHAANRVAASAAFRDAISSSDVVYGISCFNNKQRADWRTHLKSNL
jgi:enoyl-CoA hydratase/carnithine racemase